MMVGGNTVLKDNPQLTARTLNGSREPLRVILDSRGKSPVDAKVFANPEQVLIASTKNLDSSQRDRYVEKGIEVLVLGEKEGHEDLDELMNIVGDREITNVLDEGGGTLFGSLHDGGLIDKIVAFIAPMIIGGTGAITPVSGRGMELISQATRLARCRVEQFVDDIMMIGYTG